MIVDHMNSENPELLKDMHWNKAGHVVLPYTKETEHYRKDEPKGSAEVKEDEQETSTYYKLTFPFKKEQVGGRTGAPGGSATGLKSASGAEEPSSEYESIDPGLFGRVKAKIRKSQVRDLPQF
jgi:hypothetical protein